MSGPSSPVGGVPAVETTERFGLPFRHFQVAISAGTQALAWARQEDAPAGATVVADLEVSPLGFRGRLWHGRPETTLACAMVLRPAVSAEEGDVAWLMASLAALEAAEATTGRSLTAWWPDKVVDARADAQSDEPVAVTKAEIQLGPGTVRSAVVTLRFDLERLGLGAERRDELLEAAVTSLHGASESLAGEDGAAALAARYEQRCALVGRRVKIRIMPKGEVRGTVGAVDTTARLVLRSPTDLLERVTIDMVADIQVV